MYYSYDVIDNYIKCKMQMIPALRSCDNLGRLYEQQMRTFIDLLL
jgi:hypothetical protein